MSEYPKFLPKLDADGNETDDGAIVVHNAEQEAVALTKGHIARKSVQGPGVSPDAAALGSEHLEYPKHVYRGDGEARESKLVINAEKEAEAVAEGYAPLGSPIDGEVHGAQAQRRHCRSIPLRRTSNRKRSLDGSPRSRSQSP